jgi:hypothetical protein
MKMITRTSCDSEDMAWTRSAFNSVVNGWQPGSLSFSCGRYYCIGIKAARSVLFNSWRTNSIKTMFAGLDARIKWMEKWQ